MPSAVFQRAIPLGIVFSLIEGPDRWTVTVLKEVLTVLSGDDLVTKFHENREMLVGIALAKISMGETFEGNLIISLADTNRPDLTV